MSTILVVDDQLKPRRLLIDELEDAGFEVEGNALYHAKRAAAAAEAGAAEPANGVEQATPARGPTRSHGGQFQIPAGGDELLKPELLRR